jgi:hypothetical protein
MYQVRPKSKLQIQLHFCKIHKFIFYMCVQSEQPDLALDMCAYMCVYITLAFSVLIFFNIPRLLGKPP